MIFERHDRLKGKHAFLSPSQPHWLRYTDEQLYQKYASGYAQAMGTSLHQRLLKMKITSSCTTE